MHNTPTLIQIQRRYIDAVNGAKPRTRALVRGAARERALRDLRQWGFSLDQAYAIIDEAKAVAELELLAEAWAR
jgi:hypothetical protein